MYKYHTCAILKCSFSVRDVILMEIFLVDHLARVFDLLRIELKEDAVSYVHGDCLGICIIVLLYMAG